LPLIYINTCPIYRKPTSHSVFAHCPTEKLSLFTVSISKQVSIVIKVRARATVSIPTILGFYLAL
jgi:hypothetical protein